MQNGVEVTRADGSLLSPYDLKRLQVGDISICAHQLKHMFTALKFCGYWLAHR